MDEMAKSNLKTMIKIFKERKTETNFVNFQATLEAMRKELNELKKEHPRVEARINRVIKEIEKFQTTRYKGYINRFYENKLSEIKALMSRLRLTEQISHNKQ